MITRVFDVSWSFPVVLLGIAIGTAAAVFVIAGVLQWILTDDHGFVLRIVASIVGLVASTLFTGFVVNLVADVPFIMVVPPTLPARTVKEFIDLAKNSPNKLTFGSVGVLHGFRSMVLQDEHGQITEAHSISAGLYYPGVGPEHAHLADLGRARYVTVNDAEVVAALHRLARAEGIICALESAHAVAWVLDAPPSELDLICLSGRGDKDLAEALSAIEALGA